MMRRLVFISVLLLLFAIAAQPVFAGAIFGPYLQSQAPDRMQVCAWIEQGDTAWVTFTKPDGETGKAPANRTNPACAELSGLKPDVEYQYTYFVNGTALNEKPIGFVAESLGETNFVIYGDTRSGDDSFDLSHRSVVKAVLENSVPDALLMTGDYVEKGGDFALWVNFFNIEKELLAGTPIYPGIGRSDQPPDLMRRIFPLLTNSPYYSFDRGTVHVAVMHLWQATSQDKAEVSPEGKQAAWLRNDLANAKKRGARQILVLYHEPVMDVSGNLESTARNVYMPIFEAFGVTAVFSGAHYFSHTVKNNVHYFTNGGGGALLESLEPAPGVFHFYQAIHHFLLVEAGPGGASLKAINAQGEEFYAVDFDDSASGKRVSDSPTYVNTYQGGGSSIPLTIFTRPGCSHCDQLKIELEDIAKSSGTTLVVTFRSLADGQNRVLLKSITESKSATPIVQIGQEVLSGPDEVDAMLKESIQAAADNLEEKAKSKGPLIAGIISGIAAIIIIAAIMVLARKPKTV